MASISEICTTFAPPLLIPYGILISLPGSFFSLNPDTLACGRLIRREFAPHEFPSLVEAIFANKDTDTIRGLVRDDAQDFVDVIDEACFTSARPPGGINTNVSY